MTHTPTRLPIIVFGAFDRHNFGDLLFPHVVQALLQGRELIFAGLAQRDLRVYGGHRVAALAQLAANVRQRPVHILHAGGETLTCDAWQAAVMLLPPDQVLDTVMRLGANVPGKMEWAHRQLGIAAPAPYVTSRAMFPGASTVAYNAVGGVDLAACDPMLRAAVLANLLEADAVSVRDKQTHTYLLHGGIQAQLLPDPAVMVAELFGSLIRNRAHEGEVA